MVTKIHAQTKNFSTGSWFRVCGVWGGGCVGCVGGHTAHSLRLTFPRLHLLRLWTPTIFTTIFTILGTASLHESNDAIILSRAIIDFLISKWLSLHGLQESVNN
jgi:hypothetical protein